MTTTAINGIFSTVNMHDPKISASVAQQQQMLMSEYLLDGFPGGHGMLRPHYLMNAERYEPRAHGKLSMPPAADLAEVPGHWSLLQRMKELGVGMELARSTGSVFSDLGSPYSYSDLLYARSLYGAFQADSGPLPLSMAYLSERLLGGPVYSSHRHASTGTNVVIKDYPSLAAPAITLPSSSRVSGPLTLSPLHVSTALTSTSPTSSLSSPSPHKQSSVSPEPDYSHRHLKVVAPLLGRPGMSSGLYEDRGRDRNSRASYHLWSPTASGLGLRSPPPGGLYEPLVRSLDAPRISVGQFLDTYSSSLLSRHACHRSDLIKESYYNGPPSSASDLRSSPGKELTTKIWKQDRVRERQEVSSALEADREHTERLNNVKKSASTQTQYSSFGCEALPPPPVYFNPHDTVAHDKLLGAATYPLPPPPLMHYSSQLPHPPNPPLHHPLLATALLNHTPRHLLAAPQTLPLSVPVRSSPPLTSKSLPPYPGTPPPPPQYNEHTGDVQHAPLNLSLSSAPTLSTLLTKATSIGATAPGNSDVNQRVTKTGSPHKTASQDEAIEEHFRRSLGKCYSEPSPHKKMTVHVSEKISSVDDHFARALGDQMWTEIKSRSEPPADPTTVDAHFAKALGATMWKKLKAENKLVDEHHSSNSTHQHPATSTSSLQTSLAT